MENSLFHGVEILIRLCNEISLEAGQRPLSRLYYSF